MTPPGYEPVVYGVPESENAADDEQHRTGIADPAQQASDPHQALRSGHKSSGLRASADGEFLGGGAMGHSIIQPAADRVDQRRSDDLGAGATCIRPTCRSLAWSAADEPFPPLGGGVLVPVSGQRRLVR